VRRLEVGRHGALAALNRGERGGGGEGKKGSMLQLCPVGGSLEVQGDEGPPLIVLRTKGQKSLKPKRKQRGLNEERKLEMLQKDRGLDKKCKVP